MFQEALQKSGQMPIKKDLHVCLLLYQSLHDLTNPIGRKQLDISPCSYQCPWPQIDISSQSYQSTWPQTDISPCSYQPSQVAHNILDSTFWLRLFLTAQAVFV